MNPCYSPPDSPQKVLRNDFVTSGDPEVARAFALAKSAFSNQTALLSASSRSAKQIGSCNTPPDSAICITVFSCQAGCFFGKTYRTEVWIRERALLPTASFPRSDLQSHNNQSGERKGLFHEDENFTHKKFNKPLAFAAPFSPHRLRGRAGCAFAEDAGTAVAGTG